MFCVQLRSLRLQQAENAGRIRAGPFETCQSENGDTDVSFELEEAKFPMKNSALNFAHFVSPFWSERISILSARDDALLADQDAGWRLLPGADKAQL